MGKMYFGFFMELEKAYDTINRQSMCQMLRVYGFRGKLLQMCKITTQCLGSNGRYWFPANDDTALVADSEQKLSRLMSRFGRIFKKKVESECRSEYSFEALEVCICGSIACETMGLIQTLPNY